MSGAAGPLIERLRTPVDGASVAIVRIGLGALIALEGIGFLAFGYVGPAYSEPEFHFTFQGFDWVSPWPGIGIYLHFVALIVLGVLFAAGIAHRVTGPLVTLAFAYVFLLDKSEYLNHFYAAVLLLGLLTVIPADRALSARSRRDPARPQTVPLWSVWILRFQIGVIYFYAGIAKLGTDWTEGEPMTMWLADRSDLPLVGPLLEEPLAGPLFSWGGLAFDLAVVPLLLWRRTRVLGFCLALGFHLTNFVLFHIGIFPWMMIAATTVFFDPDWPRRAGAWIRGRALRGRLAPTDRGAPSMAVVERAPRVPTRSRLAGPGLVALAIFCAVQLLVPFRHHLYPGLVHWTEEGHRFAWHMKLRDKRGIVRYYAVDRATGERRLLELGNLVTPRQHLRASVRPDMVLQLAHRLAEREREAGNDVEVRAEALVSLNGRPPRHMIDPDRDLSEVPRNLRSGDWITRPELPDRE